MKRVRCPKCDNYILFDETKYSDGQSLVFQCPQCAKQFGIRIGVSRLRETQRDENKTLSGKMTDDSHEYGSLVVIENVFHYKQILPLKMGDNQIGRYQKGNKINTPIETVDPSVDLLHCVVNVSRDRKGQLRYTLRDTNSNTGTFVDNEEILPPERRVIEPGTLFTIGATSIILKAKDEE